MKQIYIIISIVCAFLFTILYGIAFTPKYKIVPQINEQLYGKTIQGKTIGKCYMNSSEDPFEEDVIIILVDYKNGYFKYHWYYKDGDWHIPSSDSVFWINALYDQQIDCPKPF